MVIISIGEWLLDHKVKVSARSAPRPFCSAKPSGLWRNLQLMLHAQKSIAIRADSSSVSSVTFVSMTLYTRSHI